MKCKLWIVLHIFKRLELGGYIDNDFSGDLDERKSTSGYIFLLSSNLHVCAGYLL